MTDPKKLQKELSLWIIRLNTDDPIERAQAQAEFEHWQHQHPEYQDQLDKISRFSDELKQLQETHHIHSQTLQQSLKHTQQSQKQVKKAFGRGVMGIGFMGILSVLTYHYFPYAYYTADYKTATGRMQSFILEDGSKITLGAKSAIKLHFNSQSRRVELVQGEIYVDVAKDKHRPFTVQSKQADYKALGTRFIVHQNRENSSISMLHSSVEAIAKQVNQRQHVHAGEKVQADAHGFGPIQPIAIGSTEFAWQHNQILADNLALPDLLQRLNRQHNAYFIYRASVLESFKVNGVIDAQQDVEQILSLIVAQYPQLNIQKIGRHVFIIQLKN
ncbi:FecR domain-containing protein [Acinetobacter sp. S40]|uniref:FecR family protein n=1 Tax=Acinetobacter sp. S40 TaxID=2767434 RepID=UPI00190BFFAA|nr:FecR domain-containing protein [Acinetobacter sp. S40]MBJ9985351.1 FecR domain-containing protein [Acinetobacter sp. S40]